MFRNLKNMAAGAIVGAAVSAMIFPQLDRKHQKSIKRLSKRACHMAGDTYDTLMDYMR